MSTALYTRWEQAQREEDSDVWQGMLSEVKGNSCLATQE